MTLFLKEACRLAFFMYRHVWVHIQTAMCFVLYSSAPFILLPLQHITTTQGSYPTEYHLILHRQVGKPSGDLSVGTTLETAALEDDHDTYGPTML